jgi:hypothetical protein
MKYNIVEYYPGPFIVVSKPLHQVEAALKLAELRDLARKVDHRDRPRYMAEPLTSDGRTSAAANNMLAARRRVESKRTPPR